MAAREQPESIYHATITQQALFMLDSFPTQVFDIGESHYDKITTAK